ncbi:MAG: LysE family transporter [Chitinivibrionales bacterium]
MVESIVTISAVGLVVGIIFSMPIAGPVSILITSHGLRGQLRYCFTAALGASIIDFTVCFIAVHGFTRLIGIFAEGIPYILFCGSIFLFIVGWKIVKARFDFEHMDIKQTGLKRILKKQEKSGFWTGLLLNASNPSLFIGWLTSSFIVISFVASLGLNVGGLDQMLGNNVGAINNMAKDRATSKEMIHSIKTPKAFITPAKSLTKTNVDLERPSPVFGLLFSLAYAFCVAVGTIIWFVPFSYFLVRHRTKLRVDLISKMIHGLGIFLCGFALYLMVRVIFIFTRL